MNYDKKHYTSVLEKALEDGFEFTDFVNADPGKKDKNQIILRHDVDYSLFLAHEMALIDASLNIRSTFAVLLSSPLYNPLTPTNISIIGNIHQLGHNIVLHYRAKAGEKAEELEQGIIRDMQTMKAYFPYVQPVFIWHNPPQGNMLSDIEIPHMINAYSDSFTKQMRYISDSRLKNKTEDFFKVIGDHNLIHMLLHPFIWMSEKDDMMSIISYAIAVNFREYDDELSLSAAWKEKFPQGIPQELLEKLQQLLTDRR
jgi:hypothetical protein